MSSGAGTSRARRRHGVAHLRQRGGHVVLAAAVEDRRDRLDELRGVDQRRASDDDDGDVTTRATASTRLPWAACTTGRPIPSGDAGSQS